MRCEAAITYSRNGTIISSYNHAYFGLVDGGGSAIDFTSGQIAKLVRVTLDEWINKHPSIFFRRALLGPKQEIAHRLGIYYPDKNQSFWEFFNEGTNDSLYGRNF